MSLSSNLTGADIVAALENGLTDWPHDKGKFLQVHGITYGFDPEQPSGSRVDPKLVKVNGHDGKDEYIQLDKVCKGNSGIGIIIIFMKIDIII